MGDGAVIIQVRPVWGQVAVVKAVTGVPGNVLRGLVNGHAVRAKKCPPGTHNSTTLFCISDVLEWLEKDAQNAGPFSVGNS